MSTLYNAGHVTVTKNSTKVYGADTAWLLGGIRAKDLIFIGGELHEIAQVNSSTELTLNYSYTGENISSGNYTIIRIARQVLSVELAEEIQALIDAVKSKESNYAETAEYANKFKKAGLKVDENHRIYQTKPEPDPIDDSDIATNDEIDSLIDDVYSD